MIEKKDFYVVPKFVMNDFGESGTVRAGRIICTKKFIFLLVEKEEFVKNLMYDPMKVDNLLMNAGIIDVIDFDFSMIEIIPEPFIYKIENMEFFNTNSNFITGGIHFKIKNQDPISIDVPKKAIRKELIEFYKEVTFG